MRRYLIAIDDEKHILDIYSRGFHNFEVDGYTDHLRGIGALREAVNQNKAPDAVILDFHLDGQGTDGGRVAEEISSFYSGEIFLISGVLDRKQRIEFRENYIVIAKGQEPEEIIDCIEDRMLTAMDKKNLRDGIVAELGDYVLKATRNLETPDTNIVINESVFKVLSLLMQKPNNLVSSEEIKDVVVEEGKEVNDAYVRTLIKRTRKALEGTDLEITLKRGHGWFITTSELSKNAA